ncbi:MAG: TlpA disulfide reductase family protein [Cytophaga sp.]|uniref:TlpA disulfide reductase family protein n=1 Tax=Cytophaga sp. TaxID=29535 RepID=UPI003F7E5BAA
MQKFIFLFLIFQILLHNTYAQDSRKFTLNGTVIGQSSGKLYLIYSTKNKRIIDSAEISNGKFSFHGSIDEPTTAELTDNLKMRKKGYGNYLSDFYLEQGVITLTTSNDHFADAKLTGSGTNKDYRQVTRYINPVFERLFNLQNKANADSIKAGIFSDSLRFYTTQLKKYLLAFIADNPDSYIGILAIQRLLWIKEIRVDSVLSTFSLLTPRIKNTIAAKKLKAALVNTLSSSIGHIATDFSRKDINGKLVTLSSFKGQYVLLDFWASWCVPCRAQTPHLRRLYEMYRGQGLKVIDFPATLNTKLGRKLY